MNEALLQEARRLADDVFRPHAEATDQGTIHGNLGANIRALAEAGYFGLGIAPEYGGMGADEATKREYTELVASACGVTSFTQQQLHSGGGFVGGARHDEIKRALLPQFAAGKILCGVAFSHLRRPGPPMVRAERVPGGYQISGQAPWVSGWSLLDAFILGAAIVADGTHLFVYLDKAAHGAKIQPGTPFETVVMRASETVEVTLDNVFVPDEFVLYERPAEAMLRADFCGITGHVFSPLGCARGSVLYLRTLAAKRGSDALAAVADTFAHEIDECRREALAWSGTCADLPEYKEHALHARTSSIILAMRAAHAAVTATGGSAHLLTHPPQRLLREAIFYTTQAQTPDVQAGTLDLLVSPDCWRSE